MNQLKPACDTADIFNFLVRLLVSFESYIEFTNLLMSSNSNDTFSPYKGTTKGEVLDSRPSDT